MEQTKDRLICGYCNRVLKHKKSIERGFGPRCYEKHKRAMQEKAEQLKVDVVDE